MKSPVWGKVLGIVLGILIGGGVVYAATYEYTVEVPSGVTVASEVVAEPGLEVNPTTLDFGEVAPGLSSSAVSINVTNVGDRGVSHYIDVTGLPEGMTLYVYTLPNAAWHECPYGYYYVNDPDSTRTYSFYLACSENVTDDSYNFTIVIREPE
jgi:hypothetical protein